MNAIEFKKFDIKVLTAAALAELINTPNPAYLAVVDGKMLLIQANGEVTNGRTEDESGLPDERIALRTVIAFGKPTDVETTKAPCFFSYRVVGGMDMDKIAKVMSAVATKLHESALETGKVTFQRKMDVAETSQTTVGAYMVNSKGDKLSFREAAEAFGFTKITAIDAATGIDTEKHQIVLAGIDTDGRTSVSRISPYTRNEIQASSTSARLHLGNGSNVRSLAVDRETLLLTMLVAIGSSTKGFANANGSTEITEVKALAGAESIRMKKTGLYAFSSKGETVHFQRKGEGIDLEASTIVLAGIDASIFRLHDVQVDDNAEGTRRTVILTARKAQTGGARLWTTQALAA